MTLSAGTRAQALLTQYFSASGLKAPDQIELYVVQLKGGSAGFKAAEMARLTKAASSVKATPLIVLHDDDELHFLGGEPAFTKAKRAK